MGRGKENRMFKVLSFLQKYLVWSIPISMAGGLLFGYFFDAGPLKRFIIPVTFIMVYPMMVTLSVQNMFKGRDLKLQLITQLINFILIPMLAFSIGRLFFGGEAEKFGLWAVGLLLIGVLPTSGMTISWTSFARGNKEAAIKMVIFGLVLGALAAPVYIKIFMGATVKVDMLHMFRQVALFVFVPLAAGLLTQVAAKKRFGAQIWNQRFQPKFPPFSALGVMLIAFLAMALKAKAIIANPGDIALILLPLTLFYVISYGVLSVIGKVFFARGDALAMVFGVVMRNLSIALAIAMTAFGQAGLTIALVIALAYVVQIQSAAWYVRAVNWIFGKTAAGALLQWVPAGEGSRPPVAKLPPMPPEPRRSLGPQFQNILYATDPSEPERHACGMDHTYQADDTLRHVIPNVGGIDFFINPHPEGKPTMEHEANRTALENAAPVPFRLPYSAETIQLDSAGAQKIARMACRMAAAKAPAIESDRQYAMRFATFLAGTVAAQCTIESQWMIVFEQFLGRVRHYLEIGCSDCMDEAHEWTS